MKFKYGDVVHHKDCPDQREMVILADRYTVHTIVLDNSDSHFGAMTYYAPSVLEYVPSDTVFLTRGLYWR